MIYCYDWCHAAVKTPMRMSWARAVCIRVKNTTKLILVPRALVSFGQVTEVEEWVEMENGNCERKKTVRKGEGGIGELRRG